MDPSVMPQDDMGAICHSERSTQCAVEESIWILQPCLRMTWGFRMTWGGGLNHYKLCCFSGNTPISAFFYPKILKKHLKKQK